MNKYLCFVLVLILCLFIILFSINKIIDKRIEKGIELCENVLNSFQSGIYQTDSVEINNCLDKLKQRDDVSINLSEYFRDIVNEDLYEEALHKEKSELSDEEIKKLKDGVLIIDNSFVEEETIYINNNGEKCIKVKDLRYLDTGDAVVKYIDGEYVINKQDIPITYKYMKDNGYFDNKLYDIQKVGYNSYVFNCSNVKIIIKYKGLYGVFIESIELLIK